MNPQIKASRDLLEKQAYEMYFGEYFYRLYKL